MIQEIKTIRPAIFRDEITSFFTLKNKDYKPEETNIGGFNLGFNTNEHDGIINENRQKMFELAGAEAEDVAYAKQIHGSNIAFVSEGGSVESCDALITQTPGLALAIQVADCAAVLIHAPQSQVIAAVHAGWRGAAANILPKVMDEMRSRGAVLSTVRAYISPCICKDHFEVGQEVAEQFPAEFVNRQSHSKPHIDLKGFLKNQLTQEGLSDKNIEIDSGCTIEEPDQFYSYRREKEQSGRMMGVVKLPT